MYATVLRIQKSYKTKWMLYFTNSKNRKTSSPHKLLLNLSDKTNLKKSNKYVALSNLSI